MQNTTSKKLVPGFTSWVPNTDFQISIIFTSKPASSYEAEEAIGDGGVTAYTEGFLEVNSFLAVTSPA
jgi:hypothetical protein